MHVADPGGGRHVLGLGPFHARDTGRAGSRPGKASSRGDDESWDAWTTWFRPPGVQDSPAEPCQCRAVRRRLT